MTLDGTMQLLNPKLATLIGDRVEALHGTSLLATLWEDQRIDLARRMADVFRGERQPRRARRSRSPGPTDPRPSPGSPSRGTRVRTGPPG